MIKAENTNYNVYDVVFDNLDDMIFIIDENFICEYINSKVSKVLEIQEDKIINENIYTTLFQEQKSQVNQFIDRIIENGTYRETFFARDKKSIKKWFEVKGKVFYDSNKCRKFILYMREISELKESETLFRSIADNINDLIMIYDKDFDIIYLNYMAEKITGYKKEQLLGKQSLQFIHTEDIPTIVNGFKTVISEGYEKVEFRTKVKDGSYIWLEANGKLSYDKNNEPFIFMISRDITERKKLEEQLRLAEKKYENRINNLNDVIFEISVGGKIDYFSPQIEKILGYDVRKINSIKITSLIHPEDSKKVINALKNAILKTKILSIEFRMKKADGSYIPVSVSGSIINVNENLKLVGVLRDISERYVLEHKLKDSELMYRNLFENSPFAIWLLDNEGRILEYNEVVNEMVLLNEGENIRSQLISKLNIDVHNVQEIKVNGKIFSMDEFNVFLETYFNNESYFQSPEEYEMQVKKINGQKLWLNIKLSLIKLKQENYIQVIVEDITKRKEYEIKLRDFNSELEKKIIERTQELIESEKKYRDMINYLDLGYFKVDMDGILQFHNSAFSKLFGANLEDDLIGLELKDFWINPKQRKDYLASLMENEQIKNYRIDGLNQKNENIIIEINAHLIRNDLDIPISIEGTITDITNKAKLEEELKESEQRFRSIAESSLIGILIIQDNMIKYVNQAYAKIMGYSVNELKGWSMRQFSKTIYYNDIEFVMDNLMRRKGSSSDEIQNYEYRAVKYNGKAVWLEVYSKNILLKGENAQLLVMIDISEKKEAEFILRASEQRLREQNIELKKIDQMKNDFLTITTHELKTPLISISGYIELILMQFSDLNPELKDYLDRIEKNAHRLKIYIDQILDVIKIDASKIEIKPLKVKIRNIIGKCVSELDVQLNNKNLDLRIDIDNNIEIVFDSTRFEQIINNLLSNAIKFTPVGGEIRIFAKIEGSYVKLGISDTGKGLSKEELDLIFNKFVSLPSEIEGGDTYGEGTGLGLYIAKAFVEAHNGKIWAVSKGLGKGSTFFIKIPSKNQ